MGLLPCGLYGIVNLLYREPHVVRQTLPGNFLTRIFKQLQLLVREIRRKGRLLFRIPLYAVRLLHAVQPHGLALGIREGYLLQNAFLEIELPKCSLPGQQGRQIEPVFDRQFHSYRVLT